MSTVTRSPAQTRMILVALVGIALLALLISRQSSEAPLVPLFLVGSLLGIALYHSVFGFTAAFRLLLAEQRSAGFRAQMVMLGSACLLFFPALAGGNLFGQPVQGFVSPAGLSVVIGSFLFGIGMQLGGGCASGTLFTVGGGSTRMLVTLLFFILGAMLGLTHLAWWKTLPALPPASMIDLMGWPFALLLNLSVFALAYFAAARIERRHHGAVEPIANQGNASWLRGPWPLLAGALALALLNFTTLYLAGRPWGIATAFALWGGSVLQLVGLPVGSWSGFDTPAMQTTLAAGPLGDITSVMDFGIVLGALLASGLAGKFLPIWRIPLSHLLASMIGGLLLGYGSRIAYGCNIGAFFSGIASGSLHGWVWIVFALIGNRAGIALRPMFKL
ncbi:YeeE/YedE family protein [Arenimonas sp.]|jgi:uncharacterized membrane protein YedE/YeeE|uniref:YeeE/YedE family protein n=1 Tax=Arenimonas sp. TaxID=1872635 RepID=UPI0037BF1EE7